MSSPTRRATTSIPGGSPAEAMHMDILDELAREEESFLVKLLFGSMLTEEEDTVGALSPPSVSVSYKTRFGGGRTCSSGGSTPTFLTPTVRHREIRLDKAPTGTLTLPCIDWLHKLHSLQSFHAFRSIPSSFSLEADKGSVLLHGNVLSTVFARAGTDLVPQVALPPFAEHFMDRDAEFQKFADDVGCYFMDTESDSIAASLKEVTADALSDAGQDSIVRGDVTQILSKPLETTCVRLDQLLHLSTMRHCRIQPPFLPDLNRIVEFLPSGFPIDREVGSIPCSAEQSALVEDYASVTAREIYNIPLNIDSSPLYRFVQGVQMHSDHAMMCSQAQMDRFLETTHGLRKCSNQDIRILLDQLVWEARQVELYCLACHNNCRVHSEKVYKLTHLTSVTCCSSAQPVLAAGFNMIGMLQSHLTFLHSVLWFVLLYSARSRLEQLQELRSHGERRDIARFCGYTLSASIVRLWKKAYDAFQLPSVSALYASAIHLSYVQERQEFGSMLHSMSQLPHIERTEAALLAYVREVRQASHVPKRFLQPSTLQDMMEWLLSVPRDVVRSNNHGMTVTVHVPRYLRCVWRQLTHSLRSKAGRHFLFVRHLWSEVLAATLEAVGKHDRTRLDLVRGLYVREEVPLQDALYLQLESGEVKQATMQLLKLLPKLPNTSRALLQCCVSAVVAEDFQDIALQPVRVLAESAAECIAFLKRQQASGSEILNFLGNCSVVLRLALKQRMLRHTHPLTLGVPMNMLPISFQATPASGRPSMSLLDSLSLPPVDFPIAYREVAATLAQIPSQHAPADIQQLLVSAADQLTALAAQHMNSHSGPHKTYTKEHVSGDDFMNLWVYIWIHTDRIYEIIPRIEITKHFTPAMGQDSYILISTQIALTYIENYASFEHLE